MKNKFKRVFSALLAVITVFSAAAVFGTSTYAAENEAMPVVSGEAVETVEAATEPKEPATAPSTAVTEPTAQPATVPTTAPATQPTAKPAPKIGNVKNIVKTSFLTDQITLTWDNVSGASG
ncbi:MAG: hypothetical protein ACI4HN_05065, partial [Ruminococcus sp.]